MVTETKRVGLVLGRRRGERIRIGDDVWLTVVDAKHGSVRLGIDAPSTVRIVREELLDEMELPPGKNCGDCAFYPRCEMLFGCPASNTTCDWSPSRFAEHVPEVSSCE